MTYTTCIVKIHRNFTIGHVYEHAIVNELRCQLQKAGFFSIIDFKLYAETFENILLIRAELLNKEVLAFFNTFIASNFSPGAQSFDVAQLQVGYEDQAQLDWDISCDQIYRQFLTTKWEPLNRLEIVSLDVAKKSLLQLKEVSYKDVTVCFELPKHFFDSEQHYKPAFSYLSACLQEAFQTEIIAAGLGAYQVAQKMRFNKKIVYSKAYYRIKDSHIHKLAHIRQHFMQKIKQGSFISRLSAYMIGAPEREDFTHLAAGLLRSQEFLLGTKGLRKAARVSFLATVFDGTEMVFEMKGTK